jgi:phosphate starvation-inducible PhoH-like protein
VNRALLTAALSERTITISGVEPIEVLGANDQNLRIIRGMFSKLSIIARGDTVKVIGPEDEVHVFVERFEQLIQHVERYHELPRKVLDDIMGDGSNGDMPADDGVLVYGNAGLRVKARTPGQVKLVEAINSHDMVFAIGPAGTGKTYTAVALAVKALKERRVRRIILTRPAVEAGENLGFLPGDLKEKLDPYLRPLYDALRDMIPATRLADLMDEGVIEIAPLAFMRGRTLDNAFVILDEAQNATLPQLKMFLTRMGRSATFVITGDVTQVDLPGHQPSGLVPSVRMLRDIQGIAIVELTAQDVIRHELVTRVLAAFEKRVDLDEQK